MPKRSPIAVHQIESGESNPWRERERESPLSRLSIIDIFLLLFLHHLQHKERKMNFDAPNASEPTELIEEFACLDIVVLRAQSSQFS